MKKTLVVAALIFFGLSSSAFAEKTVKIVGNFLVTIEDDPFGDGSKVIAGTPDGDDMLALRCLEGEMSVAFIHDVDPAHSYSAQYRIDKQPIKEISAQPTSEKAIQLLDSAGIFDELQGAKQFAVKILDGTQDTSTTLSFDLKKIDAVVEIVKKACEKNQ